MTIILFLVDTSASMNQRTHVGNTLLDVAKASVETFMKLRGRDPQSRWDRYMLLTFEDPPANIKAGWKENHATFIAELKNLRCPGLSTMGPALKHAFDLLNVNRMQTGIDTYGQGRCPYYLEPAVIIVLTDNGKLTTNSGVQQELNLPMTSTVPGSELTKEPFRWDQRIFGVVLNFSGCFPIDNQGPPFIPLAENCPLDAMCEVTGGRSYLVSSQRMLNAALESLVQKVQSGVVINFEKIGPDPPPVNNEGKNDLNGDINGISKENRDINRQDMPVLTLPNGLEEKKRSLTPQPTNTAWYNCRRLIYVPRSAQKGYPVGYWPIPEAFWPDLGSPTLPPRSAQPVVKFSCTSCEPMVVENLPFDKYELEPSPLTQFILERRQPSVCWQVFITNSAKYSDIGHPFGYLKASSNLLCVNLFVLPYNYPVLLPLLDELFKVHKLKPNAKWTSQFVNYLKTMPVYYAAPLRRALNTMQAPNLVPDNMDLSLSYSVVSYLKKLKNQAKIEMDRLVASVGQQVPAYEGIRVVSRSKTSILQRKDFSQMLQNAGGNMASLVQELTDYNSFMLCVEDKSIYPQYYRNPYDIPRGNLLDQIARMRSNFLQTTTTNTKLVDEDHLHSIPVQQMGNYQEYLKRMPQPLRELETAPVRQHMFGNPFKVNKNIMIDEADDPMMGQPIKQKKLMERMPQSPGPRKRKPGPLPKDFPSWRPSSPSLSNTSSAPSSPAPSPAPSMPTEPPDLGEAVPITKTNSISNKDEEPGDLVIDISDDPVEVKEEIPEANHTIENDVDVKESPPKKLRLDTDPGINQKKQAAIWSHNTRLKHVLYKELKKPGRNYENLFNGLNTVQGNLETKRTFVRDIIREATRFKKRALTQMLEQFEQSMVRVEMKRLKSLNSSVSPSIPVNVTPVNPSPVNAAANNLNNSGNLPTR